MNICSKAVLFLHKFEKITLSYKNNFCISLLVANNLGFSYNCVTSLIVESNTGDSDIIWMAFGLFEQACKTFLPLTSNPRPLLFKLGSPSSLKSL